MDDIIGQSMQHIRQNNEKFHNLNFIVLFLEGGRVKN